MRIKEKKAQIIWTAAKSKRADVMTRPQILIVEDEGIVAMNIKSMLHGLGYDVSGIASSAREAVKKIKEKRPDLVLMDIMLNGDMDGVKAAEKIHSHFEIPVIYLTAYADAETLQRAKITEPFGYMLKPFDERELHSTIEMALYKSKMENKSREREKWLSTILKSISDAVIATDRKELIMFMNSAAESLTGWRQKDVLGKNLTAKFNIIRNNKYSHTKSTASKTSHKKDSSPANQAILLSRQKIEIPVDYSDAPIRDDKENILGRVLVLRDITEEKKAEEEIRQSWKKLRKTLESTIQAISLIVEKRDLYTAGHQRHVSQLAQAIAKIVGFSKDQIEGIRTAALIHDVGKILLPSEILSKPGPLTENELRMVRTHARIGYDILKIIDFPYPVALVVLQHHERIDGSGYPEGLSGDKILLEAKILGVADVVEAMAYHRPYRPSLGIKRALEEISQNRGILYDPEVVDACIKLFEKKGFKFK